MLPKSVYLFYVDRPVNIAWYQEAAFAFASANVARFHPYGGIKEIFEKRRQEAKQKAFIQHQRHSHEDDVEFLMCDNGFNSLGSRNIFHGLRYSSVEIVQVICPENERLSRSSRSYT